MANPRDTDRIGINDLNWASRSNISLEKVKMAVETTKKAGIDVRLSFMLGNPGDTIESIEKTIKFAIDLDPDLLQFNITTYNTSNLPSFRNSVIF